MSTANFSIPLGGRFIVAERYRGGGVKWYLDTQTGTKITAKEYRKLKSEGSLEKYPGLSYAPDASSLADDTQADPAPRPLRSAPEAGPSPEDGAAINPPRGTRANGLLETLAPGIATVLSAIAGALQPYAPVLALTPPPPLSTPILTPLCRIVDRHSPIKVEAEINEDGRDLMEAAEALANCATYMWAQWQELNKTRGRRAEQVDQYADERYRDTRDERAHSNGHRTDSGVSVAQGQAPAPRSIWAKLPAQFQPNQGTDGRVAASDAPGFEGYAESGLDAENDLAGYHRPDAARSAALIRGLLQADAAGRAQSGLF